MNEGVARRRRGVALEVAILEAAWAELERSGYSNFTYEAVARRALTSRPVLYRRWDNLPKLATAAIAHHLKQHPIVVPDLGSLREELKLLLRRYADRAPPRLARLLFDMSDDMFSERMSFTDISSSAHPIEPLIERAVARGEILRERITLRMLRLPTSLVLLETLVTQRRVEDAVIEEIIDDLFLPVLKLGASEPVTR